MCTSFLLQGLPVASYLKKPQRASANETWVRTQTTGVQRGRTEKKTNQATVPTYLNTYNTKVYTYITVLRTSLSQT